MVSNIVALTSALADTAVGRIVLAPGTYFLSAELSITRSVILEAAAGATVTLNAQLRGRVLNINPGSSGVVQLIGLGITQGFITQGYSGGGVAVWGGTVSIVNSQIYSNAASYGGGVVVGGGTVTISSCTISGNTAGYNPQVGGGVYVTGGTVTLSSCTISGNTANAVRCALIFKSSHSPHGRLTICSLFVGRRCLRLFRHGLDN